jgi:hypothetical protein
LRVRLRQRPRPSRHPADEPGARRVRDRERRLSLRALDDGLRADRWNKRFGWRPLAENEKLATFWFWREVDKRMAIRDIPESYGDFEEFNVEFERERFAYSDGGHRVAAATRDMFLEWFPGLPKSVGRPLVYALLDAPLLDALGFPHPSPALRRSVESGVHARSRLVGLLPPRRKPRLRTLERHHSYPQGCQMRSSARRATQR